MNCNVVDSDINLTVFCVGLAWPCFPYHKNVNSRGTNPTWYSLRAPEAAICCVCSFHHLLWAISMPPSLILPTSWAAVQMWTPCHSLLHTPYHLFFFERFKLSKSLQVIRAYILPHFLWQHQLSRMCETDEEICALLPSFGSFHLHLKSLCPDLNFSHPEFNCRILNLLISLCILSLSILLPLSISFSFL